MARPATRPIDWLARAVAHVFYRVERSGAPVPDGPALLLANHPNALLDPAVIWATAGRDPCFIAKSTLFRVPVFGWLLRRSGAIPTYRRIDAADTSRNVEMFTAVAEALDRGAAICLFPEGVSHSSGRLEPLRSGAARIALDAAARGVRAALVPVGLDFVRKWSFRSRVVATYGEPFFVDAAGGATPEAVQRLTGTIAARLRAALVEADPFTDSRLVDRLDRLYTTARAASRAPADRVARRRVIAAGIARLRARQPDRYDAIRARVQTYDARLRRLGLRDRDLDLRVSPGIAVRFAMRETLAALLLGPVCLAGLAVFVAPWLATDLVNRRIESEPDVAATAKALSGLGIYAVWTLALAAGALTWAGWRWAIGVVLGAPALAVAALWAIERETAVLALLRAWRITRRTTDRARRGLRRQRDEIAEVLEDVYEWMRAMKGRGDR